MAMGCFGRAWALTFGGVLLAGGGAGLRAAAVRAGGLACGLILPVGRVGLVRPVGLAAGRVAVRRAGPFAADAALRAPGAAFTGEGLRFKGAVRPAGVPFRGVGVPAFFALFGTALRTADLGGEERLAACARTAGFRTVSLRRAGRLPLRAWAVRAVTDLAAVCLRALAFRGGAFPFRGAADRAGRAAFFVADARSRREAFALVRDLAMVRAR